MRLPASRRPVPAIPTAAMADIAFLLIIFFAVTAAFEVDRERVTLPQTVRRREVPRNAAWVVVAAGGVLRVSDGRAAAAPLSGPEELRQAASRLLARDPQRAFIVKADRRTRYRAVDAAVEALREARVEQLYLLSEPRRDERGAKAFAPGSKD